MSDDIERAHELLDLAERIERRQRAHKRRKRAKQAGLLALAPVLGPLVGEWWSDQEAKGWR